VVNDTTVTATFTITAIAAQTARNVTVTTPGGTSNAVTFTIVAPVLGSVTPNSGLRGTAVPVTIAGSGFSAATGVTVSGTGVTVSSFTVVSDAQITATFNITTTATLGSGHNVQVVVAGGNTGTLPFTVLGPTLSSIAPGTGARGTAVPVTLTGTHLSTATGATVSGTGVTVSNFAVVNDTTVTATLTVASNATLSGRNVSVTITGGAVTNNVTFTVQGPTLTSISPASHTRGGVAFQVTLTGTNLLGSTGLTVSGTGITISNFTVVNATTITANFTIAGTAGQTARTVRVNSPNATGGTTNAVTFTVQ
jgi:large repetitive protein